MQSLEAYIKCKRIKQVKEYSDKDMKNRRQVTEMYNSDSCCSSWSYQINKTEIAIKASK